MNRLGRYGGLGALGVPGPTGIIHAQEGGKTDRAEIAARTEQVRIRQQGRAALARVTEKSSVTRSKLAASWAPIAVIGVVLVVGFFVVAAASKQRKRGA